jgi:hypothetical protein
MLAVARTGGLVYLGGSGTVTTIGTKPRANLAAVSAATGTANGWNPSVDGGVDTIWASGTRVFAAGSFTTVGGLDQTGFASFSEPAKLRVDDVKITEGGSGTKTLRFKVRLSRSDEETVAVGFATQNGSAHFPGDFRFTKGLLVFLPGQKAKTVAVKVKGDDRSEGNETFFLKIGDPANATVGDGSGKATIVDDD